MDKVQSYEELKKEIELEKKAIYVEKYGFLKEYVDEEVIDYLKKREFKKR